MWGHALTPTGALGFGWVQPRNARLPDEACLAQADIDGVRELQLPPSPAGEDTQPFRPGLPALPEQLDLGEALRIWRPRIIDSSPFHARAIYEANSHGIRIECLCTIVHPRRVRWPILGRLLEQAIEHPLDI